MIEEIPFDPENPEFKTGQIYKALFSGLTYKIYRSFYPEGMSDEEFQPMLQYCITDLRTKGYYVMQAHKSQDKFNHLEQPCLILTAAKLPETKIL